MRAFYSILLLLMLQFWASEAECDVTRNTKIDDLVSNCGATKIETVKTTDGSVLDLSKATQRQIDRFCPKDRLIIMKVNVKIVRSSISSLKCNIRISKGFSIEILQNPSLTSIAMLLVDDVPSGKRNATILGNPLLKNCSHSRMYGQIHDTRDRDDVSCATPRECYFNAPLQNYTELENCKTILADLEIINIKGTVVGNNETKIANISGCLRIIGTQLNHTDFISLSESVKENCTNGKKSEISNNKNLWLNPPQQDDLRHLEGQIKIDILTNSGANCTGMQAITADYVCTNVTDDLEIGKYTNQSNQSLNIDYHNLATIRRIEGGLHIGFDSDLAYANAFPELDSVGNLDLQKPSIVFERGIDLNNFKFPKLKKLLTDGPNAVLVMDSVRFYHSVEDSLRKAAGKKHIDFHHTCLEEHFHDDDLCSHVEGDLIIAGLTPEAPTETERNLISAMRRVKVIEGKLIVIQNKGVAINLPKLVRAQSIKVYENEDITLSLPSLESQNYTEPVLIRGPQMTRMETRHIDGVSGNMLEYECDLLDSVITNLECLDYCTFIKGNLNLKEAQGETNAKIREIGGCLRVEDTELDNLDFLKLRRPFNYTAAKCSPIIKRNRNLCLKWAEMGPLQKFYNASVDFDSNKKCVYSCSASEFGEPGSICDVFEGDLVLKGMAPVALFGLTQKLKQLDGCLIVDDTDLVFLEFKELKKIYCKDKEAISLSKNQYFQEISIPKLEFIKPAVGHPVAVITQNDGFRIKEDFKKKLEKLSEGYVKYHCHETAPISNFSRLEGCNEMNNSLTFARNVTGRLPTKTKILRIHDCLRIENTNIQSVEFLHLDKDTGTQCTRHSIQNNSKLCISPEMTIELGEALGRSLKIRGNAEFRNKNECPFYCKAINNSIPDDQCGIVVGDVLIKNNCTFEQKHAKVVEIRGRLRILDCNLTSIKTVFPKLKRIITPRGPALNLKKIDGDYKYEELKETQIENYDETVVVKIEMKNQMDYVKAATIKLALGENITEIRNVIPIPQGVCIFLTPAIKKINCTKIEGDLILNKYTKEVSSTVTEITGCLIMTNTTLYSYEFLKNIEKVGRCMWREGESVIKDNFCIPPQIADKTIKPLKNEISKWNNTIGCGEEKRRTGGLADKKDIVVEGDEKDKEEEKGFGIDWIVAIVVGLIVIVVVLLGVLFIVFIIRKTKEDPNNNIKCEKKKEKNDKSALLPKAEKSKSKKEKQEHSKETTKLQKTKSKESVKEKQAKSGDSKTKVEKFSGSKEKETPSPEKSAEKNKLTKSSSASSLQKTKSKDNLQKTK